MSANFKVYHFQEVSGKSIWKVNRSPTLYKQCLGSLTSHSTSRYEQELWDGAYGFFFFYPKKARKSNRLQMTLKGSTSRQLLKDPDRELVWPGFETLTSGQWTGAYTPGPGCSNVG